MSSGENKRKPGIDSLKNVVARGLLEGGAERENAQIFVYEWTGAPGLMDIELPDGTTYGVQYMRDGVITLGNGAKGTDRRLEGGKHGDKQKIEVTIFETKPVKNEDSP